MSAASSISELGHVSKNKLSGYVTDVAEKDGAPHPVPSLDIKGYSIIETVSDASSIHIDTEMLKKHSYGAGVVFASEAPCFATDFCHASHLETSVNDSAVTGGGSCDFRENIFDMSRVSDSTLPEGSLLLKSTDRRKPVEGEVSTVVFGPHLLNSLPTAKKPPTNEIIATERVMHSTKKPHSERRDYLTELYYRGVKKRRAMEEKREAMLSTQIKELESFPFRPEITQKARRIRRCGSVPAFYEADAQMRHRLVLQSWCSEDTRECRMIPQISAGSERIVRHARGSSAPPVAVEERLYLDAVRRRLAEEEQAMHAKKTPVITRTGEELEALVESLYSYEAKRLDALKKIREEEEDPHPPLHLCTEAVTRRLLHAKPAVRRHRGSTEEVANFEPKLNPKTDDLRLRATKRRMQQWYDFIIRLDKKKSAFDSTSEKIQSVLREARVSDSYTFTEFCGALERYEEAHGRQRWSTAAPPPENYPNADLTFAPRVNSRSESLLRRKQANESTIPAHERLFETAKKKQMRQREQEIKEHELTLAEEEIRNKKQRLLTTQWSSHVRRKAETSKRNALEDEEDSIRRASPPAVVSFPSNGKPHGEEFEKGVDVSMSSNRSALALLPPQPEEKRKQQETAKRDYFKAPLLVSSDIKEAVEELCSLVGEGESQTSAIMGLMEDVLPLSKDKDVSFDGAKSVHLRDSVELSTMPSERNALQKKSSVGHLRNHRREHRKIPLFTDVVLECAVSRPTWSGDVEKRQKERRESRHRLRCVGQSLYEKMHTQMH